jgi:hypothetical protein
LNQRDQILENKFGGLLFVAANHAPLFYFSVKARTSFFFFCLRASFHEYLQSKEIVENLSDESMKILRSRAKRQESFNQLVG